MPIYEYRCKNGHKFESFNSMKERSKAYCPVCSESGNVLISQSNMRIAEPLVWFNSDGREIAREPDGGISPPPGIPYPLGG